jgi:hypothetical protein
MIEMARIVVNSYMVRQPLGGNLSWAVQWLVGFQRLGHDVYVVERSGYPNSCFDVSARVMTDDCSYGVATVREVLKRFGLEKRWCYLDFHQQYHGLPEARIEDILKTADLFIDMGSHGLSMDETWLDRAAPAGLRVLVGTEPGSTQMRMALKLAAGEELPQYDVYYTTGMNIGTAYTTAPTAGREWRPIFDPVVVDLFPQRPILDEAPFSTVMNWRSLEPVTFAGVTYGQKDAEFVKFMDLPRRVGTSLEIAVAGPSVPVQELAGAGWRLRNAHEVTASIDSYWAYILASKGEFSVCKHTCVATNVGWFSERSAAYLASARPVVMQETGFSRHLPCGQGLFAVRTLEDAVAAIDEVQRDPQKHGRWAYDLAAEYLDANKVLGKLLRELGV